MTHTAYRGCHSNLLHGAWVRGTCPLRPEGYRPAGRRSGEALAPTRVRTFKSLLTPFLPGTSVLLFEDLQQRPGWGHCSLRTSPRAPGMRWAPEMWWAPSPGATSPSKHLVPSRVVITGFIRLLEACLRGRRGRGEDVGSGEDAGCGPLTTLGHGQSIRMAQECMRDSRGCGRAPYSAPGLRASDIPTDVDALRS